MVPPVVLCPLLHAYAPTTFMAACIHFKNSKCRLTLESQRADRAMQAGCQCCTNNSTRARDTTKAPNWTLAVC